MMTTRKDPLPRQLLMAATLAVGFGTVWCILALWLGAAVYEACSGKLPPWENLVIMSDGTPLIVTHPRDNLSLATYRDLNGEKHDPVNPQEYLQSVAMSGEHEPPSFFTPRLDWDHRIKVFMDEREPAANWYFVHDGKPQGSGYFVGYERISNRLIGYVGLSGFRPRLPTTVEWIPVRAGVMKPAMQWSSAPLWILGIYGRQFPPSRWDVPPRLVHVPSGNQLRLVDLNARTVSTVFEAPEPIESVGVPIVASYAGRKSTIEQPIHVRTERKVYALNHKYAVIRGFDIPGEIDPRSAVSWYDVDRGGAIAAFFPPRSERELATESGQKQIVYRIADNGSIRDRFEVALQNGSRPTSEQANAFQLALGLPAPALLLAVEPLMLMAAEPRHSYGEAADIVLKITWPSIAAVSALASVLAAIAWRRSRGFGFSRRAQTAWVVFVLLLGVPGYVGFLLARRWPVRLPCPRCHSVVPRDRDACAECGTLFSEPAFKGIEIFA